MKKAACQLIKDYAESYHLNRDILWMVYTIGLPDEIRTAAEHTAAECGFKQVQWMQAGGVITTHGGPAAFGIAGFSD